MYYKKNVLFAVKALSNQFHRLLNNMRSERNDELTGMQRALIGYIYKNMHDHDVFQRDIEQEFNIRRATATVMLQSMEKNGYIERIALSSDRRLKKIQLTEKAAADLEEATAQIAEIEQQIIKDLSQEDIDHFFYVIDFIMNNLKKLESSKPPTDPPSTNN